MAHLVPFFSTGYLRKHHPTGISPLVLPYHCPREEKPQFPDRRFDALALRHLEGLGTREVGVVRTRLKVKDSTEDFEERFSGLVIVSRGEGPRHTPEQQGLNHLGLQRAGLQPERGSRHIV